MSISEKYFFHVRSKLVRKQAASFLATDRRFEYLSSNELGLSILVDIREPLHTESVHNANHQPLPALEQHQFITNAHLILITKSDHPVCPANYET